MLDPLPQHVQQTELGVKYQGEKYSVFATPFYSLLSNVINKTLGQNANGTLYVTPSTFNSTQTVGLELESAYSVTDHFSVRGVATLQRAIAKGEQLEPKGKRSGRRPTGVLPRQWLVPGPTPIYSAPGSDMIQTASL
jgi:iron complex outermembrane receptor protein